MTSKYDCAVSDCKKIATVATEGKRYCGMHYQRIVRNGDPYKVYRVQRSCKDTSKITLFDTYATVTLTCNKEAIIDLADVGSINRYNWYYSNTTGYAYSNKVGTSMQQFLVGKAPAGKIIEHDNRNKLDNRRENLLFKTQNENNRNSSRSDNGGIAYHKLSQKYQAYLTIDYKFIYLGVYEKREDAVSARAAAMQLAGDSDFDLEKFKASWKLFRSREQEELKRDE